MRKDRYKWRDRVIIELGNPNYVSAFAFTREKDHEGKWRAAGLELHIYDTGEEYPPALPKEIYWELLKEKDTNPTRDANQTTEEASAPADNNSIDITMPKDRPSASGSRRPVYQENTMDSYSAHQSDPPFYDLTTSPTIDASTSAAQSKQCPFDRKKSRPSSSSAPLALPPRRAEAHLPRTVAPVRPPRSTIHLDEQVLLSADILAPSTSHSPLPHINKTGFEFEPILAPSLDSLPETDLPQASPRTTKQSEPSQSLLGIQFDSPFCSGTNAVESLSEIARDFLRRYVCTALPFVLLTTQKDTSDIWRARRQREYGADTRRRR